MSSPAPRAVPEPPRPLVIAAPTGPRAQDELVRVSWARTVLRLALEPDENPWSPSWRLRRRGPHAEEHNDCAGSFGC